MINAILERPRSCGIAVPSYSVETYEDGVASRWKRLRRWNHSDDAVILPWIGLNASGSDLERLIGMSPKSRDEIAYVVIRMTNRLKKHTA